MLAAKFGAIFPHLDERQRRLLMGAEARALGHGGIRVVALAAGVREATVSLGVSELDSGAAPLGRARKPGGGRKRLADLDPGLRPALLALVEPDERGDPMSPLRWTTKSLRVLAAELTRQGHRAGADTVADLLHEEGFSLQGNAKALEGKQSPDRDAQFRYLREQVIPEGEGPVKRVDVALFLPVPAGVRACRKQGRGQGGAPGWTNDLEAGPACGDTVCRREQVCGCGSGPCGVPEVCPACELQRCARLPIGHDDRPCPSVCSISSSSVSAAGWSCSAAHLRRKTRNCWCCGTRSSCFAAPLRGPGWTGPTAPSSPR